MSEIKVVIEIPGLVAAIERVAQAIGNKMPVYDSKEAASIPCESVAEALGSVVPVAPTTAPTAVVAPVPPATVVTAVNNNPISPAVPTNAPAYTLEALANAGTALVDAGKMNELMALLAKYGVEALTSLNPAQYGAVAQELRALGAQI